MAKLHVAVLLFLSTAPCFAQKCIESLQPIVTRELPAETFVRAHSVAWVSDGAVAIGSDKGVYEYRISDRSLRQILTPRTVPDGLPDVEEVATDGQTLVAFNSDYSYVAVDLTSSRVLAAKKSPGLQVTDMAVRGKNVVVLGFPVILKADPTGSVWSGTLGAPWESYRLLHSVPQRAEDNLRSCLPPFGGAIRILRDGTIAAISPAEAGIHRFRSDGTPLPVLASGLEELVVPRMSDIREHFFGDVVGRYKQVLNRQPTADDLVETSDGLAVVVRHAAAGSIWWELWMPSEKGDLRTVRLGVSDKRDIGGHMRCDARGQRVACLFGKFTQLYNPDKPYLLLFDLSKTRPARCGT